MNTQRLRAAIITVSTTASESPQTDKSGPALKQTFENESVWNVADCLIVTDDVLAIHRTVTGLVDGPTYPNVIVTTGGTGFAVKDVTPEAITPLLDRNAPGIVHGMLAASLHITPFAMMSRPVAGVRKKTVIVTLPGSPKGATENLQSIIKLLPHACRQAAGEDSRGMHASGMQKMEEDAGVHGGGGRAEDSRDKHSHDHHHHHHHHSHGHGHTIPKAHTDPAIRPRSNDPQAGPSTRNRHSPFPMLSVEEALATIRKNTPSPTTIIMPTSPILIGHTIAADVRAANPVPAFQASIVDGYAIRTASHTGKNEKGVFPIAFVAHAQAGDDRISTLKEGQIARITTGAPVPDGADAVVMVEDTVVTSRSADGREETEIEILTDQVKSGENIRKIGSDVQKGDVVMRAGEIVSELGGEFGLLASVGIQEVKVYKRPVVGVLSTGDELVVHDRAGPLKLGEVVDTNRPTLLANVRRLGYEAVDLGIVEDKQTSLESRLRSALVETDVLITTGGVSMGELDLLKPTLERNLGGTIHFGRVAMKPGKPTTFATVPAVNLKDPRSSQRGSALEDGEGAKKVVFSLPGNPASAVVTFLLFALPALRAMEGVGMVGLPRIKVRLGHEAQCDASREEYHRVVVGARDRNDGSGGGGDDDGVNAAVLWATSTGGQRSSRIGSFKASNALVRMPKGGGTLKAGAIVDAFVMGEIGGLG